MLSKKYTFWQKKKKNGWHIQEDMSVSIVTDFLYIVFVLRLINTIYVSFPVSRAHKRTVQTVQVFTNQGELINNHSNTKNRMERVHSFFHSTDTRSRVFPSAYCVHSGRMEAAEVHWHTHSRPYLISWRDRKKKHESNEECLETFNQSRNELSKKCLFLQVWTWWIVVSWCLCVVVVVPFSCPQPPNSPQVTDR